MNMLQQARRIVALQGPPRRCPNFARRQFHTNISHCNSKSTTGKGDMAQTTAGTSTAQKPPPAVTHILETCLMVKDIRKSTDFYKNILSVEPFLDNVSLLSSRFSPA